MSKKNEVEVLAAEDKYAMFAHLKIDDGFKQKMEIDLTASIEHRWGKAREHLEHESANRAAYGLLIQSIKNDLPHGQFLPELERRGFDVRGAQQAMAHARFVFSQPVQNQARLLEMPVTKVAALAQADPEVVEVLMEDGDTVEKTTVKGLINQLKAVQAELSGVKSALNDQIQINQGLTKKKLKSDLRADTQLVRDECLHQQALVEYGALALLKAWEGVMAEDTGAPEHNLRRDQIVHAVRAAAAAAVKVARQIEQEAGGDVQVTMLHMLTPEEAKAWQADWDTIRSGLRASDAARFDRLQAELPRDVGRPKGSKTKGKAEA